MRFFPSGGFLCIGDILFAIPWKAPTVDTAETARHGRPRLGAGVGQVVEELTAPTDGSPKS